MIFRVFGELKVAESSKGSSRNGSERRDGKMAIGGRGQGSLGMTEELAWRKSPVGERERETLFNFSRKFNNSTEWLLKL